MKYFKYILLSLFITSLVQILLWTKSGDQIVTSPQIGDKLESLSYTPYRGFEKAPKSDAEIAEDMKTIAQISRKVRTYAIDDAKRVLTNVKTRGIWGEIQLGNILEQLLTIDQYESNVNTNPHTKDRVEFALKLPGKSVGVDNIWLPIDAKFPQEDYQRLLDAQEKANIEEIDKYTKALENRVKLEAKTIAEKYICLPYTTDFAILFLPYAANVSLISQSITS